MIGKQIVVNKCPLKNICNKNLISKINNNVLIINKIIIQTYQFLNLYLIKKYDNNEKFPKINRIFVRAIIRTITKKNCNKGMSRSLDTKKILEELKEFYQEYKLCIEDEDIQNSDKISHIIAYEIIDIITNIENNIKKHFVDYVNKFVNISLELKNKIKKINKKNINNNEKKQLRNKIYIEFRKIKKDIIKLDDNYDSDKKYHGWIDKHRKNIIRKDTFDKDSIHYDLHSNAQDYLQPLFYMNKKLEEINDKNIKENKDQIKLFQIIPQRTSIKPCHITIDTISLINILNKKRNNKYLSSIKKYQEELWNKNFKTNKKEFKRKGYQFNYMIKTDGIACSGLLFKLKNAKSINIQNAKQDDKYIEDIKITKETKNKRIVTIDPNLSDIIYCVSKDNKNISTFRYTQNQRRLETRKKKYSKIIDKINKKKKINKKSVKELETEISKYNSKSVNYRKFLKYCKKKNEINRLLFKHYSNKVFRKLKLNTYINTQKSESKMINNFKKKFGEQKNIVIIIGDYDNGNMKGKEPVINKKIRDIFKKNKFEVYKINEFRTSKLCNKCEDECEIFLERKSNKPKNKGKIIKVWGLTRCKNVNCSMIHNRDKNSALNMYKIVESIFLGKGRPKKYCR